MSSNDCKDNGKGDCVMCYVSLNILENENKIMKRRESSFLYHDSSLVFLNLENVHYRTREPGDTKKKLQFILERCSRSDEKKKKTFVHVCDFARVYQ